MAAVIRWGLGAGSQTLGMGRIVMGFRRALIVGSLTVGLTTGVYVVPAQADVRAVADFVGTLTTGGLSSRVSPSCSPTFVCPSGLTTWSLSITLGSGVIADTTPEGTEPEEPAAITLSGSVGAGIIWGWCDDSAGWDGAGSLVVVEQVFPATYSVAVSDFGWVQSAGTVIAFSGTATVPGSESAAPPGWIEGVMSLIPPNAFAGGSGSCLAGTATGFPVIGTVSIVDRP